ncbi:MAG TPA: hypothetical protein ENK31_00540, partial [Nannocystis exedens]|nr:hypothetical protein [Nannocystis exedens]
ASSHESVQLANPDESTQFTTPAKSAQFASSDESVQLANPDESTQFTTPAKSAQFASSDESVRFASAAKSTQFTSPTESTQFASSTESTQFASSAKFASSADSTDSAKFAGSADSAGSASSTGIASSSDFGKIPNPLAAFARCRPDHIALRVRGTQGVVERPLSAAQLRRQVAGLAAHLAAQGVTKAMRVALLGQRSATWVIALHAISWLGASVLPLDPAATASELRLRTQQAAALVIIDLAALGDSSKICIEFPPVQIQIQSADLPRIVRNLAPLPPRSWGLADERALLFTSGSSGTPKPVPLHTAQLLFATLGGAIHLGHDLGDVWHACLPPWHIGGLAILLRTIWCQTTLDLGLTFCPSTINSAIDRGTLTQLSLVPAMLRRLLEDRGRRRFPPSLRWILLGGAAADEADLVAAQALGATICPTWGMTESAAQVATRSPAAPRRPGVIGPALPFVDITCDPNRGNLCISGPQIGALGPIFRTQDLGSICPNGQVSVHGRIDRVVISGGRNIDPAAIERILLRHPGVAQALVLGLPDPRLGEQLVAVIAPRSHADRNLARFAAANLHPYDRPRRWALVRTLPTTAAGKISATTRNSIRARLLHILGLDAGPERTQGVLRTRARKFDEHPLMLDAGVDNIIGSINT